MTFSGVLLKEFFSLSKHHYVVECQRIRVDFSVNAVVYRQDNFRKLKQSIRFTKSCRYRTYCDNSGCLAPSQRKERPKSSGSSCKSIIAGSLSTKMTNRCKMITNLSSICLLTRVLAKRSICFRTLKLVASRMMSSQGLRILVSKNQAWALLARMTVKSRSRELGCASQSSS